MERPERCANCDAELRGPWCHDCGQRVEPRSLALRDVLASAFEDAFSADGRLARTVLPFLARPGRLVAEYAAGRRVRYTNPVRLYLFALLVGFLAFRWSDPSGGLDVSQDGVFLGGDRARRGSDAGAGATPEPGAAVPPDAGPLAVDRHDAGPMTSAPHDELRAEFGPFERWLGPGFATLKRLPPRDAARLLANGLFDAAPTAVTLMVPLFALLLKLLFPRRPYVLHLLLSLNLHALALILFAIAALIGLPPAFVAAYAVVELHQLVALRRVYRAGWPRALLTAFVLFVAHLVLFGVAAVTAIGLALASL